MTHEEASGTRAAERYILAEMPDTEREGFEEHFFSCEVCAEDIRLLSVFVENAKAILRESSESRPLTLVPPLPRQARKSPLLTWIPAAIAASLAIVSSVQMNTIQRLREPKIVAVAVVHGESRGESAVMRAGQPLSLLISLDQPPPAAGAISVLNIASGEERRLNATVPPNQPQFSLYLPEPNLKPGRYAIVIGATKYPFEVR